LSSDDKGAALSIKLEEYMKVHFGTEGNVPNEQLEQRMRRQ